MKDKIIDFFKKVKGFSLFDFMLARRVKSLTGKIDFNLEMIDFYNDIIEDCENKTKDALDMIASYEADIKALSGKIKNINKI